MFTPRTTPLVKGETPWDWNADSVYQCTWYVFWRFYQVFGVYAEYFDRDTKTGYYTNAKEWLKNYRDPLEVKDITYTPVAGDIVVYNGEYGHVMFMETNTMTSEYRSGDSNSFRNAELGDYKGELLGYLHYPYESLNPVERNKNANQIQTTDTQLRIRTKPDLKGNIVGHVKLGYYNVLNTKQSDGYTWYEIYKDRWCANIGTIYLPSDDMDFVEEIKRWSESMTAKVKEDEEIINNMKKDMLKMKEIAERWL